MQSLGMLPYVHNRVSKNIYFYLLIFALQGRKSNKNATMAVTEGLDG